MFESRVLKVLTIKITNHIFNHKNFLHLSGSKLKIFKKVFLITFFNRENFSYVP